MLRMNPR
jgi:serine/threonine protein kinase